MMKNCTECVHASGRNDGIDTYCEIHKTGVFLTETCNDFMDNPSVPVVSPFILKEWTKTMHGESIANVLSNSDYRFILSVFDEYGEILFSENGELYSINIYKDKIEKPVRSIIDLIANTAEWCINAYTMINESGFVGTQEEYDRIKKHNDFAEKYLLEEVIEKIINLTLNDSNNLAKQMAS